MAPAKVKHCAFQGCTRKSLIAYHSYDHTVLVCDDHREEWEAMCQRARDK